jgi:5-methylcytosine-specific restriction enzyme subunit McrC
VFHNSGHLIYARGRGAATRYVTKGGKAIHCHSLDLDQDPEDLMADVRTLAENMARSVMPTAVP